MHVIPLYVLSFEALESDLKKVLDLRRKLGAEVDGFCPLYAYRRLLNCAHHMRMALYETQSNYAGKTWERSLLSHS